MIMKNVLIIEVEHRGHHFVSYLKNIIKELQNNKIKCYDHIVVSVHSDQVKNIFVSREAK